LKDERNVKFIVCFRSDSKTVFDDQSQV